jgi:predicted component of type VI protein secretion system
VEPQNGAGKTMCKINDKNQIAEQYISLQTFHRTAGRHVKEIIVEEQFEPRILESFDPTTQELYRHLPTTIHIEIHAKIEELKLET